MVIVSQKLVVLLVLHQLMALYHRLLWSDISAYWLFTYWLNTPLALNYDIFKLPPVSEKVQHLYSLREFVNKSFVPSIFTHFFWNLLEKFFSVVLFLPFQNSVCLCLKHTGNECFSYQENTETYLNFRTFIRKVIVFIRNFVIQCISRQEKLRNTKNLGGTNSSTKAKMNFNDCSHTIGCRRFNSLKYRNNMVLRNGAITVLGSVSFTYSSFGILLNHTLPT